MPLPAPPRLPPLDGSFGTAPRATSSLASVLSFNSKSSLSASRLSSNSLLSPPAGLGRLLDASEAESLPDEILPDDFGAESLDELPPLMTALPWLPKSMASSSVGTTDSSSLPELFLGLAGSRRASLSPFFFGAPGGLLSSEVSEKISSSPAAKGSGSSFRGASWVPPWEP